MTENRVFKIEQPYKDPLRSKLFNLAQEALERFLYLDEINKIYECAVETGKEGGDFIANLLAATGVEYELADSDLENIPTRGGGVVVANHPFGGVEGVMLLHIIRRVRPDAKIMANYMLARMPEMGDHSIYVDPFGKPTSATRNIAGMKESIRWVRDGHLLLVFPSGEVSNIDLKKRVVCDPPWSPTIARIIQKTSAPVLPIFFQGRNGNLFQTMGLIHPRIRTAMLPYELVRRRDDVIKVNVGHLIPWKRLADFDQAGLNRYIRFRTYLLCNRNLRGKKVRPRLFVRKQAEMKPVEVPVDPGLLDSEIGALEDDNVLIQTDQYLVGIAPASKIPNLLKEIGRVREITFRASGEGTGKPTDLDQFDEYYLHLFLWNIPRHELAGAYRLAKAQEVVKEHGMAGLYTTTLFHYPQDLLVKIGPALELGRSFVRPEYQKSYSPLMLIWKGLAKYICRNPEYKSMFGPVSINNDYQSVSRQLMAAFLQLNNFLPELATLVKARNPFRQTPIANLDPDTFSQTVTDPKEVSSLIADIETEQKGLPVLLRQYLKLGGNLLGFNIDPNFSDVLDGLIWVDLTKTKPGILERFMGKDEMRSFLEYHSKSNLDSRSKDLLPECNIEN